MQRETRRPQPAGSVAEAAATNRQTLPAGRLHPLLHLLPHRWQEVIAGAAKTATDQHELRSEHIEQRAHTLPQQPAVGPPHRKGFAIAAIGTALVTGLLFGFLPARRAAALDPVMALAKR